jgi:hypothetical protein
LIGLENVIFNRTGTFLRQVSPDLFRKTKKTSISPFFSVCWRNLTKKMTGTRAANAKTSQRKDEETGYVPMRKATQAAHICQFPGVVENVAQVCE